MAKATRPLTNLSGTPAAGAIVTIDVPVGPFIYDSIHLAVSGTAQVVAQIVEKIEVIVGEAIQRTLKPAPYDAWLRSMASDGSDRFAIQNNVAGGTIRIPIWFYEPWRPTPAERSAPAWGTSDVDKLQVKVYFRSGATAPTLAAYARFSFASKPLGSIAKCYLDTIGMTGLTKSYNGFAKTDLYSEIVFFEELNATTFELGNDNSITSLDAQWGTTELHKLLTKARNDDDLIGREMTPSAKTFQLVFDGDGPAGDGLPMVVGNPPKQVGTFNVDLTTSSATARNLYAMIWRIGSRD
jgi:hypothetical protein